MAPSQKKPTPPFVTTLDLSLSEKLREGLLQQGFSLSVPPHTLFNGKKKGVSCTLYQSGKLVVQGKEMAPFIEFFLEPEILKEFSFSYKDLSIDKTARIGIDEAGKGDFFGPLCVAGAYAYDETIDKLVEIGVRDSKRMNDKTVLNLAKQIRDLIPHHIVRIFPTKYNELYKKFSNLNSLLAWGHATAIEALMEKSGCSNVIIDQFAHERVVETALQKKSLSPTLKQRHRAEEDIVVAAASILARAAFLEGLERLSKECGIELPKGASQKVIAAGKALVLKSGEEALLSVGKEHFKTRHDILSN